MAILTSVFIRTHKKLNLGNKINLTPRLSSSIKDRNAMLISVLAKFLPWPIAVYQGYYLPNLC
ncbi:hypothetical protein VB10N_35720 [Vibrio sp. 10N]|nr:hypothetical protein VB10N_35720 [Vibrio sp. 10N]